MNMNWLQSLIYGLFSGFTEFLPISSHGHQQILMQIFGVQQRDPVRDLVIHAAILFSLYVGCKNMIDQIRREQRQHSHRAYGRMNTTQILMDQRFVKNTAIIMITGILILSFALNTETSLLMTSIFLLVNGIILFLPSRMMQGNKDVRSMTYLDSLFIGISSALSAFSGISRVGCITSVAIARGSSKSNAINWAFLLSIPALYLLIGMDVLNLFTASGIPFWPSFFTYILSAIGAYIGGYYSIMFMRFLTIRIGYYGFAYYCWGASLFSFMLYLTVV